MEIIRIPVGYKHQIKWCSPEDCEYILKTLFSLVDGEIKEVENSMRGGIVHSMFREAVQMENKARSKKGEKWQEIEVATSSATSSNDIGCTQEKKRKETSIKENKIQEKKFTPPTLPEVEQYFEEKGYTKESAKKAWDYYEAGNWKDSKGNKVKNWKQKMLSVWFKPENKNKSSLPPEMTIEILQKYGEFGKDGDWFKWLNEHGFTNQEQLKAWRKEGKRIFEEGSRERRATNLLLSFCDTLDTFKAFSKI